MGWLCPSIPTFLSETIMMMPPLSSRLAVHPFGFWQARDCRIVTDPRSGNETDLPPPTPRCETYCTNFEGMFLCSCDDGWTVDDGGYECRDLDECTHSSPNQAKLFGVLRSVVTRRCGAGFNEGTGNPCVGLPHRRCQNVKEGAQCVCEAGFEGTTLVRARSDLTPSLRPEFSCRPGASGVCCTQEFEDMNGVRVMTTNGGNSTGLDCVEATAEEGDAEGGRRRRV